MHLPDDVHEAIDAQGVYQAPIRPTDGDRELVHHLCAIVSVAHACRPESRLTAMGRSIISDMHDALDQWFHATDEGVPDRLVEVTPVSAPSFDTARAEQKERRAAGLRTILAGNTKDDYLRRLVDDMRAHPELARWVARLEVAIGDRPEPAPC